MVIIPSPGRAVKTYINSMDNIYELFHPVFSRRVNSFQHTRFYLADFGAGDSNFAGVLSLPFETVKLDASLLRDAEREKRFAAFIGWARTAFRSAAVPAPCRRRNLSHSWRPTVRRTLWFPKGPRPASLPSMITARQAARLPRCYANYRGQALIRRLSRRPAPCATQWRKSGHGSGCCWAYRCWCRWQSSPPQCPRRKAPAHRRHWYL